MFCNFYNGILILYSLKLKNDSWYILLIMYMLNILNVLNINKIFVLLCVNWKIINVIGVKYLMVFLLIKY